MVWPTNPRPAKALLVLRDQVNAAAPKRSKVCDGMLGDVAHASRASDHNPNKAGVVTAIDITHDPRNGVDSYVLADTLRTSHDPRIKYIISNRRIASSTVSPWQWRPYSGSNPHDKHLHLSLVDNPSLYDVTNPWKLAKQKIQPDAPQVLSYPTLRKGDHINAVTTLQKLLGLPVTGHFDVSTEDAVKKFQTSRNLVADGVVGTYTWQELEQHPLPPPSKTAGPYQRGITATVFGGAVDNERSAYDGHLIGSTELCVALPFRLTERPLVEVVNPANGKRIVASIEDVGPWNVDDPYWTTVHGRPQAESGTDRRGRKTNKAGIDLSPAAARILGINGMGIVEWRFLPTTVKT